jgi:hypothetical protein
MGGQTDDLTGIDDARPLWQEQARHAGRIGKFCTVITVFCALRRSFPQKPEQKRNCSLVSGAAWD